MSLAHILTVINGKPLEIQRLPRALCFFQLPAAVEIPVQCKYNKKHTFKFYLKLKLVAIFNVWNDYYLLRHAVDNIRQLVDGILIIASTKSNYGEVSAIPKEWQNEELFVREPRYHIPLHSETDKRNYGLEIAKSKGYTHFITMDSDEFYRPDEFLKAKEKVSRENLNGIVCPVVVYFKSPALTLGRDVTLVPHIHKLTPTIRHEFNRGFPYAWHGSQIRIDPSRSLNINTGVSYMDDVEMHHYSWIRKDYHLKIRNSTARKNLERSTMLTDLSQATEGYYVQFYRKRLSRATVSFGIHEYNPEGTAVFREDLQPGTAGNSLHFPG